MNIIEEYALRKKLDYSPLTHLNTPQFLLFKANKSRWSTKWCIFTSQWENGCAGQPGSYKLCLTPPVKSDTLRGQNIFNLSYAKLYSNSVLYQDFEGFFYKWDLTSSGLIPVFDDEAMLCLWEIFVFVNESWFQNQSLHVRLLLLDTLNFKKSFFSRITSYNKLFRMSFFDCARDTWCHGFLHALSENYLERIRGLWKP